MANPVNGALEAMIQRAAATATEAHLARFLWPESTAPEDAGLADESADDHVGSEGGAPEGSLPHDRIRTGDADARNDRTVSEYDQVGPGGPRRSCQGSTPVSAEPDARPGRCPEIAHTSGGHASAGETSLAVGIARPSNALVAAGPARAASHSDQWERGVHPVPVEVSESAPPAWAGDLPGGRTGRSVTVQINQAYFNTPDGRALNNLTREA